MVKPLTIKIKYSDIIEYIIVIFVIINCRSMWTTFPDGKGTLLSVLFTLTMGIFCILGFATIRQHSKSKRLVLSIFGSAIILLYGLFFIIIQRYNIRLFVLMLFGLACLIVYYINNYLGLAFPGLLKKYVNVATIISVISLAIWLTGSIFHIINPTGEILTTWTPTEYPIVVKGYFGIQYERQTLRFLGIFDEVVRNSSFFAEAPMASFVFSTATMIEALLNRKPRKTILIALFVANLSTLATTGLLVDIAIIVFLCFRKKPKRLFFRILKFLIIPIALVITVYAMRFLLLEKIGTSSGMVRIDDFVTGYRAWRASPIFGHGYENGDVLKYYISSFRSYNSGFSNSIMQILAQGGLVLFVPYASCFALGIIHSIKQRDFNFLVFIIGFLIVFSITLVSYTYITYMILLYIVTRDSNRGKERRNNHGQKRKKVLPSCRSN